MRHPFHILPPHPSLRLRVLHERPYILSVPNLLSSDECRRLRAKAAPHLMRQTFHNVSGRRRTSSGCVLRNDEVPTLRARFARLAGVAVSALQPLKVSRYEPGERFDIHTDAFRGDLRDAEPDPNDWWADRHRVEHGVKGAPISGCNRMLTIFVYLNTVARGGRTRWRWTNHDLALGGSHGTSFYEAPGPGSGRTEVEHGSGADVSVAPVEGTGVLHFPACTAAAGGWTDYNAYHEAEPTVDETKWVAQQFIWSHERLDWRAVLDAENHEPSTRRSDDVI